MKIQTVVLIKSSGNEKIVSTAERIEESLVQRGIKVLHLYGSYNYPFDPDLVDEPIDLAFAIGGDGTTLKAGRICAERNIPILPVKVGDFGFINEIQYDEWEEAFDLFVQDEIELASNFLLKMTIGNTSMLAINDVTVCSAEYGTIRIEVWAGKHFITRYRADGLIIATPTGSTAHSLSIGGPIMVPGSRCVIINPIAPFTLSNRPIILPIDTVLKVVVCERQRNNAIVVVDGRVTLGLVPKSEFTVTNSGYTSHIAHSSRRSYFEVLRCKLGWTGEFRA